MMRMALLAFGVLAAPAAWGRSVAYAPDGNCGGFPRVDLKTAPGQCVGLVAPDLGFPRGVTTRDGVIYVVDMGDWQHGHGRVLALADHGHAVPRVLASGLDRPSGIAFASDGRLYVATAEAVLRIDIGADGSAAVHPVLTGLPGTGRHPLVMLSADRKAGLFLSVGSATNNCEPNSPRRQCAERDRPVPRAAVLWFHPGDGAPIDATHATIVAKGLRNPMALAVLPSGALVSAVNARDSIDDADPDLSDEDLPHEPYVSVKPGVDYGWPYCYDNAIASPEYRGWDCTRYAKPDLLLPAHAAPLAIAVYKGPLLPKGGLHLVMTWHGYRHAGHRVEVLDVDADGHPVGSPHPLIWGWHDVTEVARPHGSPTGIAEMDDGSVLVTDDHNGALLRLVSGG